MCPRSAPTASSALSYDKRGWRSIGRLVACSGYTAARRFVGDPPFFAATPKSKENDVRYRWGRIRKKRFIVPVR